MLMFREPPKPKELRPHQSKAIDMLRRSIGSGKRKPVLQLSTGSGKTLIAAKIIEGARRKGNRVLFVCDAIQLIDQTVEAFTAEGLEGIGVIQAQHPMTDWSQPIQVASIQTLVNRKPPEFDLCIIDECFPAGTLISTPDGDKPIECMAVGDIVENATGVGLVKHVFRKRVDETCVVRFTDGTTVETTREHPFFTRSGWKPAADLAGKSVCSREGLRRLWRLVEAEVLQKRQQGVASAIRDGVDENEFLRVILRSEILEPDGLRSQPRKAVGDAAANWSQANAAGREWQALNGAASSVAQPIGRWVGAGVCGENLCPTAGSPDADVLQNRRGEPAIEDCDRGGRDFPCREEEVDRREEGHVPAWKRVESVEIKKQASPVTVFNLHVSHHPSYFAGGNLVHNCHEVYEGHKKLMEGNQAARYIGLSATPWTKGLGLIYDDLIKPVTVRELTDLGYVARLDVYAPSIPDLSDVDVRAGEYNDEQLSQIMRGEQLIADIVSTWRELGEGRPTLAFCVDRAHARAVQERFEAAGIGCGYIDGTMNALERLEVRRELEAARISIVVSVGTMIKGVDWKFGTIIDAQPRKSIMRHVQKLGRLRPFPEWPLSLVLDHSGNSLLLGLPIDIDKAELCTAKKGERTEAGTEARAASKPKLCPNCDSVKCMGEKVCPCGHVWRNVGADIEEGAGELARVGGGAKGPKKAEPTKADKQAWFSQLRAVAMQRGRSDGWVSNCYRERFGCWPKGLARVSADPSPEVLSYVRSKDIRWAKRKSG